MISFEQNVVVKAIYGNNVVVALPGAGKTHTVKYAVEELLKDTSTVPLIVTFTNEAANELSDRLSRHLGAELFARCHVTTFDSLMVQLSKEIDSRKLVVKGQQQSFLNRAYMFTLENYQTTLKFNEVISLVDGYGRGEKVGDEDHFSYQVYLKYLDLLNNASRAGYRDLNMVMDAVMDGTVNNKLSPLKYSHIIVDEFQDTDTRQCNWLMHHMANGVKATVVCDDDQSIYSWRGAKGFENINQLIKNFNAKLLMLTMCYRCRPEIIEASGQLIGFNQKRIQKNMRSGKGKGGLVNFYSHASIEDEADFIVSVLKQKRADVGVITRQNRYIDDLEKILTFKNIDYVRLGGSSIFDEFEVIAVLHLLRAITTKKLDDSLINAIAFFGEREAATNEVRSIASRVGTHKAHEHISSDWKFSTQNILQLAKKWNVNQSDPVTIKMMISELQDYIDSWAPSKTKGGVSKVSRSAGLILNWIEKTKLPLKNAVRQYTKKLNSTAKQHKEKEDSPYLIMYHLFKLQVTKTNSVSFKYVLEYLNESESNIQKLLVLAELNGTLSALQTNTLNLKAETQKLLSIYKLWVPETHKKEAKVNLAKVLYHFCRNVTIIPEDELQSIFTQFISANGSIIEATNFMITELDVKCQPPIKLMTYHASKGLQFKTVILFSFNEGVLPSSEGNIDPELREEERRIAYVGMSRAEEELLINSSGKVSTFLTESFPEVYSDSADWVKEDSIEVIF